MEATFLQILWFILVTVLFIGFFFLEGFDYGVGMLTPFIGKNDRERRVLINTIGPHWDGNEVWLLTAGGASFAAFPHFYATLFSGFYVALVLMLLALISRAVVFEYRSKNDDLKWRKTWDWVFFIASFVIALLWGVAVGNLMKGVELTPDPNFNGAPYVYHHGGLFSLLSPFTILSGLVFVFLFAMHGANFIALKTEGEILERTKKTAWNIWIVALVLTVIFVVWAFAGLDTFPNSASIISYIAAAIAALALIFTGLYIKKDDFKKAFWAGGLTIIFATIMVFAGLFPYLIPASNGLENSITVTNASSSEYTLTVMSIVAVLLVPLVLFYQIWSYKVFKGRIKVDDELEY